MHLPDRDLKSTDSFSYIYISLFMFTYRKTKNCFFNKIIDKKLASLKADVGHQSPSLKTITLYRKELVEALTKRFFPDSTYTADDPIDLITVFTSLTALYDLEIPESFFEDLDIAQKDIADDVESLSEHVRSFFSSLHNQEDQLFTYDIIFILLVVSDFLQVYYLEKWKSVFVSIKETLLSDFFTTKFNIANHRERLSVPNTNQLTQFIPHQLQQLLAKQQSFIIIPENYALIEYGDVRKIKPDFELKIRELFNGKYPSQAFKEFLLAVMDRCVLDNTFRLAIKKLLDEQDQPSYSPSHKVSA